MSPAPDSSPAAPPWRNAWTKRAQIAVIAGVGYPLMSALTRTYRWTTVGADHYAAVQASGRQPIMAFWHGRILPATAYFRDRGIVVVTSENFDGEWIARIITKFGYGTARGSTSRGGVKALVRVRRDMAAGRPAAFMPSSTCLVIRSDFSGLMKMGCTPSATSPAVLSPAGAKAAV